MVGFETSTYILKMKRNNFFTTFRFFDNETGVSDISVAPTQEEEDPTQVGGDPQTMTGHKLFYDVSISF